MNESLTCGYKAITRDWPPYLSIRLDPSGRLVRRAPDPLAYPETLPSNDPLWNLIFGATRTVAYRHNMTEIVVAVSRYYALQPTRRPNAEPWTAGSPPKLGPGESTTREIG